LKDTTTRQTKAKGSTKIESTNKKLKTGIEKK
jgi:hypothetical protein